MKNIPEAGKVFVVKKPFSTLAEVSYETGDTLELIELTGMAPFGFQSKLCNWIVRCKHFCPPQKETVWSGIYFMIESGILVEEPDVTGYRGI